MLALVRKAYRDLTKRRVRSLLTIGAIAIGVAGIVAIVSTAQNLTRAQSAAYYNSSQADISFSVWDAPSTTIRALSELPNVADAELRDNIFTRCKWNGEYRDVSIRGLDDFADIRINQIRLFGDAPKMGEFIAETSVRELFPVQAGDQIICRGRDGASRALTLTGFAASPNYPTATILNFATIYANANDVKRLLGINGANQALLKLRDTTLARETADLATRLLNRRGVEHGSPEIRDPQNFMGKRELDALILLLLVFSIVGLITSGFLVANTLAAMATEQVGEIGTMKAIGGTRVQVLTVYVAAAMLYGIVGTIAGIALGTVGSWQLLGYIGGLLNLDIGFTGSLEGMGLGTGVGIGVTLLAGLVPSFAATGIRVKDALEAYGITSTFGQGWVDRALHRMTALPPLAAMSLRNLARRKARSIITVAVIAVAVAASLAAQTTSASVNTAIDSLFLTYRADAWTWFDQWVGSNFAENFRAVEGVRKVEVWSLNDAWVDAPGGLAPVKTRLWGVPGDTSLYAPRLVAGRWYEPGENDAAVISTDLARDRDLELGDVVNIEINRERRAFRVVGITIDNSIFLGSTVAGKVFVPEDMVQRMQDRQGWATFFALGFDRHDPDSVAAYLGELSARFKRYQMGSDSAYRQVRGAKEQSRILSLALFAMSLIIGAIGALGVLNTLSLNVLERRREIGVLRSIGASDANLVQVFVTEGLALGLVGWGAGVLIGYPLGMFFVSLMQSVLFHIDYLFTSHMLLASLLFALAIAVLASLAPALGAARLRVGHVLRYE